MSLQVIGSIIKNRDMSLNEASRKIGISVSHLSYIIKGETAPSPNTLINIIKNLETNKIETLDIIEAYEQTYPTKIKELELAIFSDAYLVKLIFGDIAPNIDIFLNQANLPDDIFKLFGYNYDGKQYTPKLFGVNLFAFFGILPQANHFFTSDVIRFLTKINFGIFHFVEGDDYVYLQDSMKQAREIFYTFEEKLAQLHKLIDLMVSDYEKREIIPEKYEIIYNLLYTLSRSTIYRENLIKDALGHIVDFYALPSRKEG